MSKNLAFTLTRAKNNGIREGIDAVCEAMALAHYNAAIELDWTSERLERFTRGCARNCWRFLHRAEEIRSPKK